MVKVLDEHERTMAFAEVALGQIKSLRQTAVPRNYEIWYVYATGYNSAAQQDHQRDAGAQRQVDRIRSRTDLRDLSFPYQDHRPHRQGRLTRDRRNRRRHEADQRMRSACRQSYDAESDRRDPEACRWPKKPDQIKSVDRIAGEIHPRDARHQQGARGTTRLSMSKNEISNLQQSLEAIRAESLTDPLTGLGNRKYFDRSIEMAVQNGDRAKGEPLSLLMFDIDHFKSFNDSYGHLTGDQVLRLVGMSLKQTIKGQDITARYGGEEFAVVLPNTAHCVRR